MRRARTSHAVLGALLAAYVAGSGAYVFGSGSEYGSLNSLSTPRFAGMGIGTSGPASGLQVASGFASVGSQSATFSQPTMNQDQTWNNAGALFHLDDANVTNTASLGSSTVLRRQVGGVSKFEVRKNGQISTGLYTFPDADGQSGYALCTDGSGHLQFQYLATGGGSGSGVSSITGTAHQVIASASTGAVTLSTPQSIDTTSNVQFATVAPALSVQTNSFSVDATAATWVANKASAITGTLPDATACTGRIYYLKNENTGPFTIATTSSQTLDGFTSLVINTKYGYCTVQSDGSNWQILAASF